jgi:hypothetical protein
MGVQTGGIRYGIVVPVFSEETAPPFLLRRPGWPLEKRRSA